MACGLVASNLNLKPGECLRVRGEVTPDAKSEFFQQASC
ncbi:LGALS1 isoform 5 [Pongo abelii]|uniref:LGALS1 isoform 5 n=1 Tax=Pongo abelii TaxID=9601 RepID=A0A2J8UW86_PONAB|nr:LGALS1 isoform 5 [Pongo abelii]